MPPPLPRGGLGIPQSFASSPEAPLLGELASEARLRGWTKESLTVSHCWTQPLRHCFAMPLPGLRHPASAALSLASCWPRPQQRLPVSAAGGGRRRCPQRGSHWQAGPLSTGRLRPDMAQKGGPCLRGQRLLDKRALSSCRWPRQRSTTVSGTSYFARPAGT